MSKFTTPARLAIAAFAGTLAVACAPAAFAANDQVNVEVSHIKVALYDLDFSRPEAAATAFSRLNHAACRACDTDSRDLKSRQMERTCVKASLARAIADVGVPSLHSYAVARVPDLQTHAPSLAEAGGVSK